MVLVRDGQLQLGVGVNSGVAIFFTRVGMELDLRHFLNSNSTSFYVVTCPVKMRRIENITLISEAIASEYNFSRYETTFYRQYCSQISIILKLELKWSRNWCGILEK
jgi:hypothetical protein